MSKFAIHWACHYAGRITTPDVSLCRTYHYAGRITTPDVSLCRTYHYARRITTPDVSLCRTYHYAGRITMPDVSLRRMYQSISQGAVLLTVGWSYVGNDVTHSTLLDRTGACSYENLPKDRLSSLKVSSVFLCPSYNYTSPFLSQ